MSRIPLPVASAAMAVMATLVAVAAATSAAVGHFDSLVSAGFHTHTGDSLLAVGYAVTLIGGTATVIPLTVAAVAAMVALRLWHSAAALAASVALTQGVVSVVKALVERPRPAANAEVAGAGGFSFPSGHSATTAALFGVLALVAARKLRGPARVIAVAVGVALIVVVGLSRIVLGAHYPTDVLAGWLTGGTIALACYAAVAWARSRLARRTA